MTTFEETSPHMKLNHKLSRVEIESFEVEDALVFKYFNGLPESERDSALVRAIRIGVLALMEDRISSFFAKTTNELGVELENLKMMFDVKQEIFHKTAVKGTAAEDDIIEFLQGYVEKRGLKDTLKGTGKIKGLLPRNKTGDIVANVNGDIDHKIVIECKFDKSYRLGDVTTPDIASNRSDTAWSQLLEASVNRDANTSIIVFDKSLVDASILNSVDGVAYINDIGFVCIIDYQAGNFQNIAIAYMLARGLSQRSDGKNVDAEFVNFFLQRLLKDIKDIQGVASMVKSNITNNQKILKTIEKSLLSIEFDQQYLTKYLQDGTMTKEDFLDFYMREEIRDKFKLISKEIEQLDKPSNS